MWKPFSAQDEDKAGLPQELRTQWTMWARCRANPPLSRGRSQGWRGSVPTNPLPLAQVGWPRAGGQPDQDGQLDAGLLVLEDTLHLHLHLHREVRQATHSRLTRYKPHAKGKDPHVCQGCGECLEEGVSTVVTNNLQPNFQLKKPEDHPLPALSQARSDREHPRLAAWGSDPNTHR